MKRRRSPNREEQLRRVNQTLRAITRVNQAILHVRHEQRQLLREVCDILVQERDYTTVWIGEVRNGELFPAAASAEVKGLEDVLQTWIVQSLYNQDAAKQAGEENRTVIAQKKQRVGQEKRSRLWTTAAVPIRINDQITAVLNACTDDAKAFDAAEIRLLEELAANIGFALESMVADAERRQAQEALRTSEERFRHITDHSLVGILLIQNDTFRYVNPALARMFGYDDPEEIIDRLGPMELTAPESRELVRANIARRISGEIEEIRYTFKGLRKDGSVFDVEAHGSRALHARRPAVISTIMDITDRERSRRQLEALSKAGLALSRVRSAQEALHRAVDLAPTIVHGDAVSIFLIRDDHLELAVAAGYETLDAGGRQFMDKNTDIESLATYQHMLATHAPILIADTVNSPLWAVADEPVHVRAYLGAPLIVRGEVIGFLNVDGTRPGQFSDVDAQHLQIFADYVAATIEHLRLIASLTEEHQRLTILNQLSRTLSETLETKEVAKRALTLIGDTLGKPHGVIHLWDAEARTVTTISEQGEAAAADIVLDIGTQRAEHEVIKWITNHRRTASQTQAFAFDIPLKAHDDFIGVLSLTSSEATVFRDENRQLLRTLSVPVALALQNARFYESAARQAAVLKEALHRQEELDRMKDELLQNVSHELRTPLALVTGYTQMLRDETLGPLSEDQTEALEIIAHRSAMLRGLVEDITMHWQIENPEQHFNFPDIVDLREFVQTAVREFGNEAKQRKITLTTEVPEYPVAITSYALQIHRLLDNLISNALKFTPPGGHVTVRLTDLGDKAGLSVCDTGIGVPEDKLVQIFDRFFQVDGSSTRAYGGLGLGLALVKSVVEVHNGTIRAVSPVTDDPEHPGTCILIELPVNGISYPAASG